MWGQKGRRSAVVSRKRITRKECHPLRDACHNTLPSTSYRQRVVFELVQVVRTATKEHARQDSHNGIDFGPDDVFETEVDHVPSVAVAVVVNGKFAEWLGVILEVWYHVVKRLVRVDFARLGDKRNVELQ
jgi:hypothetical protein